MDLLRWILLGVGALVVIGVYWWSRRNAREEERFFRAEPGVGDDEEIDPLFATPGRGGSRVSPAPSLTTDSGEPDLEAVHRELSSLQALLQTEEAAARKPRAAAQADDFQLSLGTALDDTAIADEPVPPVEQEKIVVLYLVAHPNQLFTASAIGESLRDLGLEYGDMHIYHRYPEQGGDTPVFGVANLVEPGTLEPEALAETGTPGLALFLQLPGPLPPLAAFDLFVSTAQQLATRLDGELRDKSRNVLSRQMLEHLRDDVQQYARRLRLPPHA